MFFGKMQFHNNPNFRCFFCLHVRTGTMIVGVWHLILNSIALGLLLSVLVRPDIKDKLSDWAQGVTPNPSVSVTPTADLLDIDAPPTGYNFVREACSQDIPVAMVITLCTAAITVLLIYGSFKGRANCLMPFFCLQIFDFVVSALTAVGYFSSLPNVRRWLEALPAEFPLRERLLSLDAQWLSALVLLAFVACMLFKAYLMAVVWSCYKYLKLQHLASCMDVTYRDYDAEALLSADLEMVLKLPPPPPPYSPPSSPANTINNNNNSTGPENRP